MNVTFLLTIKHTHDVGKTPQHRQPSILHFVRSQDISSADSPVGAETFIGHIGN